MRTELTQIALPAPRRPRSLKALFGALLTWLMAQDEAHRQQVAYDRMDDAQRRDIGHAPTPKRLDSPLLHQR
ncbi:MAG: hypothetical protein AAF245_10635 [Pseudomonadota bacterium]